MANLGHDFLAAALGKEGAKALLKAADRQPQLAGVLIPRAILGWLDFTTQHEFEGEIPGVPNSYIQFAKSGTGFSGSISIDDQIYTFSKSSVYHLAASIATAIGLDPDEVDADVRDNVLSAVGESIDTLAKAQVLVKELKAKKELAKVDLPGKTHQPTEAEGPEAPTAPQKQPAQNNFGANAKPKKPKLPRLPSLSVSKSDAARKCAICGGTQFADHRFKGCICYQDLAKSITTTAYSDGYVLAFKPGTDLEVVRTLIRHFN